MNDGVELVFELLKPVRTDELELLIEHASGVRPNWKRECPDRVKLSFFPLFVGPGSTTLLKKKCADGVVVYASIRDLRSRTGYFYSPD